MKMIKLAQNTPVDGVVRHVVEGALIVTNAEAERLQRANLLDGDPEDAPQSEDAPNDGKPETKKRGA